MGKLMLWLEGKNTRLRLLAGTISLILWALLVVGFFVAWIVEKDLSANGGLALFYAVGTFVAGILGVHMATRPKDEHR